LRVITKGEMEIYTQGSKQGLPKGAQEDGVPVTDNAL